MTTKSTQGLLKILLSPTILDFSVLPSKIKVPDIDAFNPKQMGQLVDKGQMIAVGTLAIADIGQSEGLSGR